MKLLFSLLLSGLLLSPLFAFAGRVTLSNGKPIFVANKSRGSLHNSRDVGIKKEEEKAFNIRLNDSFCPGLCREIADILLPHEAIIMLNNAIITNQAAKTFVQNVQEIYINLELSGRQARKSLIALAFKIAIEPIKTEQELIELDNHIKALAGGMDRATARKQADILEDYRIYQIKEGPTEEEMERKRLAEEWEKYHPDHGYRIPEEFKKMMENTP